MSTVTGALLFVCSNFLTYVFSNYGFQFVTELETSKKKFLKVFLFVCFFTILRRNPFFGITRFFCQKNITYHLQISREEITIVCGFWLEHDQSSGGLKADVSMLLL